MTRCDYANARVHGLRGRFLGGHGLRSVASSSPGERTALLAAAGYAADGQIEPAEWLRLDGFIEGAAPRRLWRAFLAFEDVTAIKIALRGLAAGERPERIAPLLSPTPSMPPGVLRNLAGAGSVEAAVALLPGYLRAALASALPDFRKHPVSSRLELSLDRAVFAEAIAAARGWSEDACVLRTYIAARADLANAATVLKLAGASELFLDGGSRLPREIFLRWAGLRPAALADTLAAWGRSWFGPGAAVELATPWRADRLLARTLQHAMRREARLRPLSIAVLIAFVLDRKAESRRVRLLLSAGEFGLPIDDLPEVAEA